jgi:hypothetical protein
MRKRSGNFLLYTLFIAACFSYIIGVSSCSKSNSGGNIVTPPDTTINSGTIYIDITLNGVRTLGVANGQTNQWAWGSLWGVAFADTSIFPYNRLGTTFVSADKANLPSFSFSKGSLNYYALFPFAPGSNPKLYYLILPSAPLDSFFAPGNYNYSVVKGDTSITILGDTVTYLPNGLVKTNLSSGINIMWKDSTGTIWQTFSGSGDQTGSYFTIVTNTPNPDSRMAGYEDGTTITANLDCMLYDGKGNSIHLTNGSFRLPLLY